MRIIFICIIMMHAIPVIAHDFNIWGHCSRKFDFALTKNMKSMGVSKVWCSGYRLPIRITSDGKPEWRSCGIRTEIMRTLAGFEKSSIKVVFLTNIFCEKLPDEKLQHNRWKIKTPGRSFVIGNDDIVKRLDFYISELKRSPAFGGIIVDDEPGVVPGGDVGPEAVRRFGEKPPGMEVFQKCRPGIVQDDDPCVRWYCFQKSTVRSYYASIYTALRSRHPGVGLYVIPAAPYFSALQLSLPGDLRRFFSKRRRVVSLDEIHVLNYRLYVQYYIAPLSEHGWKRPTANGLWLGMCVAGLPQFCPKPIFASLENKGKTLSVPAFKRFILQTFAESGQGIVYSPCNRITPELYKAGALIFRKYLKPLCAMVPGLRLPGRVAILYSNTTRALADVWRENPLERYEQVHHVQALAYYFFKRGIPFEIIAESRISKAPEILGHFDFLVVSGVTNLTRSSFENIHSYAAGGGKVIVDGKSYKILPFAEYADFNAGEIYHALEKNVMTPGILEYQAGMLEPVFSTIFPANLAPVTSLSRDVNINYMIGDNDLYVLLVNDNVLRNTETEIVFSHSTRVVDLLSRECHACVKHIRLNIPCGEMKALKLPKFRSR